MIRSLALSLVAAAAAATAAADRPFIRSELIFPLEHWHNHASCVVESPNGDLIACWFHGSGERTADDVRIEGSRLRRGSQSWEPRFTMADTPGYPDTNCTMFIDPQKRLWLMWPTILANEWPTALMKYVVSSDYSNRGAPRWELRDVLHVTPGPEFEQSVLEALPRFEKELAGSRIPEAVRKEVRADIEEGRRRASDKLSRRLGWMTRAHPLVLDGTRLIVPLYSDGFSFSLMAITDDWGNHWHTSRPLIGAGNIQPSVVRRSDGTLYTLMRDNGPPPKRLHQSESRDRGETWSFVSDSEHPNPGSGAEIIGLRNGNWVLIGNDTERGRNSLLVQISEDEGRTWPWKRHLEFDPPGRDAGSYHYPSITESRDGTLHATYSFHLAATKVPNDADGLPASKSIKHAHFNEAWVRQGDSK